MIENKIPDRIVPLLTILLKIWSQNVRKSENLKKSKGGKYYFWAPRGKKHFFKKVGFEGARS
jgi:hypothetical protein